MRKNIIDENELVRLYAKEGMSIISLCKHFKIGKIRLKEILNKNGIKVNSNNRRTISKKYIVSDHKIKKYPPIEGKHYVAISKIDGSEFNDIDNKGGFLTSHIKNKIGKEETLWYRNEYYKTTGNYWWEQWFDIELREDEIKETKKCPYCDWETVDINNNSGMFETHLMKKHNLSKNDYLKEHSEDREYFRTANKTLDLQMENDENKFVTCQICGKKLRRIDHLHLNKHNITLQEYKRKYNTPTYCNEYKNILLEKSDILNQYLEDNPIKESKAEREIMDYYRGKGFQCSKNRSILNNREIDIYFPDYKVGVEFNGVLWHCERYGKDKYYHLNKTKDCFKQGVNLIHINEDDYVFHKDIVYYEIDRVLGIDNRITININDCDIINGVKCIDYEDAIQFIKNNTLTKYGIKKHDFIFHGLYHNKEIVGLIAINSNFLYTHGIGEVIFVNSIKYKVEGIENILFEYFKKKYQPLYVYTLLDMRFYINVKTLLSIGFKYQSQEEPQYVYYNFNKEKYTYVEKGIISENYDEYDKVYDCGYLKYIWED